MDIVKVGLDFGTHQTKICLQITPDEGHGEPSYEFFKFKDLRGRSHYALPSIVQINKDNTLSYGFVDVSKEKFDTAMPVLEKIEYLDDDFDIEDQADILFRKYKNPDTRLGEKDVLRDLLKIRKDYAAEQNRKAEREANERYQEKLKEYYSNTTTFHYFKQATFAERPWVGMIDSERLSIWYISYLLFILEERFGDAMSINLGVPADEKNYDVRKRKAVSILLSAFNLVEQVYEGDFESFLNENVIDLYKKTKIIPYSAEDKEEFNINVFPEAYASLISLTSKGKIAKGMCLNADIGGGTTDISFFAVEDGHPLPFIYRYWSLPCGLNYIAERSGFDYSEIEKAFEEKAGESVIEEYNGMKDSIVKELYHDLLQQLKKESTLKPSALNDALTDRIVVYNGGGSSYEFISGPVRRFSELYYIDKDIWKEENVLDKEKVGDMCHILTTSYGLSIGDSDEDVKLSPFTNLFKGLVGDKPVERQMVDKDFC